MDFHFSTPGTSDLEAGRGGPGCQNLAFQRFDPMILYSFLWRIRWTTLENHRTKQMMVYEQITIFIKNIIFMIYFGGSCQIRPSRILNPAMIYFANHVIFNFGKKNLAKYKKGTVENSAIYIFRCKGFETTSKNQTRKELSVALVCNIPQNAFSSLPLGHTIHHYTVPFLYLASLFLPKLRITRFAK